MKLLMFCFDLAEWCRDASTYHGRRLHGFLLFCAPRKELWVHLPRTTDSSQSELVMYSLWPCLVSRQLDIMIKYVKQLELRYRMRVNCVLLCSPKNKNCASMDNALGAIWSYGYVFGLYYLNLSIHNTCFFLLICSNFAGYRFINFVKLCCMLFSRSLALYSNDTHVFLIMSLTAILLSLTQVSFTSWLPWTGIICNHIWNGHYSTQVHIPKALNSCSNVYFSVLSDWVITISCFPISFAFCA